LHAFGGLPLFEALRSAILGDATDHLQRPVDGRHQIYIYDLLEPFNGIDARLAGNLVDPHRKLITRNTGSRHAHRDGGVELAAHGIENGRAEGVVGCITLKGISDPPAGDGVYFSSDRVDVIAHVYERHSAHIAARQIWRLLRGQYRLQHPL
jgi:hypothetical protein